MTSLRTLLHLNVCMSLLQRCFVLGYSLGDFIQYHEPVYYNENDLRHQHRIVQRSPDSTLHLDFQAFDRIFKIRLKRDESVYSPELVVENSQGVVNFDTRRAYSGRIEGEASFVHGIISSSGHFEGTIRLPEDVYIIERLIHHTDQPRDHHSVIYNVKDVNFNSTLCKSNNIHKHLLNKIYLNQNQFYDKETNYWIDKNKEHRIHKRAIDPDKTTCSLYMQADHLFYQKFYSSVDTVLEQLTLHVQAVDTIFKAVDFDGDGSPDNIRFIIKRMKVHTDQSASNYKFPSDNYGVETFLDIHSQENYDAFCLSYMFTNRDFNDGVLGLAWTAALNSAGGVCEKYKTYQDGDKSLNTGLVTLLNYGKDIPSAVSHVTFAHEIGHNFGSNHDPETNTQCAPGGNDGNYIMYARATSGLHPNNDEFSSCSISDMGPILEAKARGTDGCFIAYPGSICGNKVVESGEACDCGWDDECDETCCNPQVSVANGATPCELAGSSVCSPSASFCCSSSCSWYAANENHVCRTNTSCMEASVCDGSATCPEPAVKSNGTMCAESQVCFLGECSGSICLAYGLEACQCSPTNADDWKDEKLCQVCCVDTSDGSCKSSYALSNVPDAKALPGNPCNDYKGYCDVFNECREVDPNGPLSRLRNLIFSGAETVKEYLTKHWYIGLAAGLGLVIITVLVAKFCAKSHKPKSPKKHRHKLSRISPHEEHI